MAGQLVREILSHWQSAGRVPPDGISQGVDRAEAAHRLSLDAEDALCPRKRSLELRFGWQFLAAEHHVAGDLVELRDVDRPPGAHPRLVRLDGVTGDDEVLHDLGQPRLIGLDPLSELGDGDLVAPAALRWRMSGQSRVSTNAASCITPSLSGLAIFLRTAMSALVGTS